MKPVDAASRATTNGIVLVLDSVGAKPTEHEDEDDDEDEQCANVRFSLQRALRSADLLVSSLD